MSKQKKNINNYFLRTIEMNSTNFVYRCYYKSKYTDALEML